MPTIEVTGPELLKAVQHLAPEELDEFIEKALLLRDQPTADKLSAEEKPCVISSLGALNPYASSAAARQRSLIEFLAGAYPTPQPQRRRTARKPGTFVPGMQQP